MQVICECGCNWKHIDEAFKMIEKCEEIGVKFCKFQLFTKEMAKDVGIPEYLSLNQLQTSMLFNYGKDRGVEVFFSVMYPAAVEICEKIGVRYYKIRYADQHNDELFKKIRATKKPFFTSHDYYMEEHEGIKLHCIPEYPASIHKYLAYSEAPFDGISSHTPDTKLLQIAQILDKYEWFEIHVKLDGTTPIEDKWSCSFSELEEVINK